jgi:hypothetical protein
MATRAMIVFIKHIEFLHLSEAMAIGWPDVRLDGPNSLNGTERVYRNLS